jgi:hypothetical protein
MAEQKKAKLEMLKRAQEKQMDPEAKAKLAEERIERAKHREIRQVENEKKRKFKALQDAALKVEKETAKKRDAEKLAADQKAKRDARYAARKAKR